MGDYTPNLNLYKPDPVENVDVQANLNANYDKIDTSYQTLDSKVNDVQDQINNITTDGDWVSYVPLVGFMSADGEPSVGSFDLGDGSTGGEYWLSKGLVHFTAWVQFASNSTLPGNDTYGFYVSLPFEAKTYDGNFDGYQMTSVNSVPDQRQFYDLLPLLGTNNTGSLWNNNDTFLRSNLNVGLQVDSAAVPFFSATAPWMGGSPTHQLLRMRVGGTYRRKFPL